MQGVHMAGKQLITVLFLCALGFTRSAFAAEVILDGTTATGIVNLEVQGKLYNVQFVYDTFNNLQAASKLPFVGNQAGARIARGLVAELLDETVAITARVSNHPDPERTWRSWDVPGGIYGASDPVYLGGEINYQPASDRWDDGANNGTGSLDSNGYFLSFSEITPLSVNADLDPWTTNDEVQPDAAGSLFVAVLGQSQAAGDPWNFDVTIIDDSAFGFGAGRAVNIAQEPLYGDYDGDGITDAAFVFRAEDTGIQCGETEALLRGETVASGPFAAQVSINTVNCSEIPQWAPGNLIVTESYVFNAVDDCCNDNDVFAMNLLGERNKVLIHNPNYWRLEALDDFYNAQPGVSSERYSGEITALKLKDVGLLYLNIGLADPAYYSTDEVAVMKRFLYTGGTIVFVAVGPYNFFNFGNWNDFLASLGSQMSVSSLEQNPAPYPNYADTIVSHPLTAGVNTFRLGAGNDWHKGTGLIKDGVYRLVVLEEFLPKMVSLDVDPWSAGDEVDPDSDTSVVVAVLGSSQASGDDSDFDATQIDPATLQLGIGEASGSAPQFGDYDSDTNQDAAFTFDVQASGIACEDTEVELSGGLLTGEHFEGVGAIVTPDCDAATCHP